MVKRTVLYDWHKRHGARFIEFGGWEMPVQYTSIVQEHEAVRQGVGVFDISHMGQVFVEGDRALEFLQRICTNDMAACSEGKAVYSHLCNPQGGVIDDIFVYCLDSKRYLVVVNAGTTDKDFAWMLRNKTAGVELKNRSSEFCTHRGVKPYAGTTGFDAEAWCPDCQYYKLRRAPKKRMPTDDYAY